MGEEETRGVSGSAAAARSASLFPSMVAHLQLEIVETFFDPFAKDLLILYSQRDKVGLW